MRKAATFAIIASLTLSTLLGMLIQNSNNAIAGTPKSGTITVDDIWDIGGSPYWIEDDVYIQNKANLTIDPGVEVRFNEGYGLYIINGTLNASGTPLSMINFTFNGTNPGPGNWSSIHINSKGNANIRYCNITYATYTIEIIDSSDNDIQYNNITDNYEGITLRRSSNNTISNNNITDNENRGIFLSESWKNDIKNNNVSENLFEGIFLSKSWDNNVTNNRIWDNWRGLYLSGASGAQSKNNNISLNSIHSNTEGIRLLTFCPENIFNKNNISSNTEGVNISSSNNLFFHNIFWENTLQAYDSTPINFWDNGYPIGGNYWSDFDEPSEGAYDNHTGPNQNEPGSDGIVDDPYINIGGWAGPVDNYPLIRPSIERIFVYLNSPKNNSVVVPGTFLDFIIVGEDIVLVEYSLDGGLTNWTLPSPWDINTISWSDGPYIIDIYINDSKGNISAFWYNISIDSIKPEITLNSPPSGSIILPGVEINLTVFDINLADVNYSFDGGANSTLLAPYNIDSATWADGNHTIQIYAKDMAGNLNTTIYNFTIDGTNPSIILFEPINYSVVKGGTLLRFNISDPHLNTSTINYSVNGQIPQTFVIPYDINTTTWANGTYIIVVKATDILGNANTSFFNVIIDSIPPYIYLISPSNNSIIKEKKDLDFEVVDDNLYVVNYTVNYGTNETLTSPFDLDITSWPDGPYRIDIFAIDLAGNTNSTFYNFTIAISPKIILVSPSNNSLIKAGVLIDFKIEDLNLAHVNYSINGGSNQTIGFPYSIATTGWEDRNYIIEIHARDAAGNTNSSWYNFTIDSSMPSIVLNSPLNNSIIPSGTMLDFNVSDTHLASVNYSINGDPFNPFSSPYDFDTSSWEDGVYSIIITANDLAGNENISEFIFSIDSTPPIIQLLSPPNGTSVESGTLINFSIIDDNLDLVNYSVNSGANQTLTFPFSINTITFPDGDCIVVINALDLAGNFNITWYNFTILDTTKPFIFLNSPDNRSYIPAGTIIDLYVYDLHLKDVSYSLDNGIYVAFGPPYDINTTNWDEGIHTLMVRANDNRSNTNISMLLFTIDSIDPIILIVSPSNDSVNLPGTVLDFIIVEDNLNIANYSINDDVMVVFSPPFDISTTDWEDGAYDITIYAEDKTGNENTASFRILIDSTPPVIQLNSPVNGSSIPSRTIIDIKVSDANLDIVEYSINDGQVKMFYPAYDISTTGWLDGNYTIKIHAKDRAGNTRNVSYSFELDSTAPEVTHISVAAPFYPYDHTNIIIHFSEPMDKESVESALNISPSLNYTIAWYDDDKTLLLANFEGVQLFQFYSVDIGLNATDIAGNPLINFQGYGFVATIDISLDTDEDGMPDGWEIYYELDPNDPLDADEDKDDDGYSNLEEFEEGSDPNDPESVPLKPKEEASTLEYWWLIPVLIALLVMTILLFILLMGERKEEPKGPVEELEDMYLAMRAEKDIKAMESLLMDEERLGERLDEAKIMVQKAKEAFEEGDYNRVTVLEKTLRDLFGAEIEEGEVEEYETGEKK